MSTYESLGPDLDNGESGSFSQSDKKWQTDLTGKLSSLCQVLASRKVLKSLILGQGLSLLLSGTGVFSGLLQNQDVNIPTAQSFPVYCILCLLFATHLAYKGGDRSITKVLSQDGWKYALLGLIDVEANFLVVKAYAYASVTSVQILDCFSIAAVLVLSRLILHTKYQPLHYIGVLVSVLGLGGLITADVISGKNADDGGSNAILGDLLVILGAILYGVSNVGQEFFVKHYNKSEFLGMIGMFGSLVSGIQVILIEHEDVSKVDFTDYKIVLPYIGFVIFMLLIYLCMSYVVAETSATLTNISVLSADFYSLILGIFIFKYSFHILYFIAFVIVIIGIAIYSIRSTEHATPSRTSSVNDTSSIT